MELKSIKLYCLGLSAFTLVACTTTQVDTSIGTAAGAGIGYAIGGGTGALIGGGAGALAGYEIGKSQERKQYYRHGHYYYR